MSTTICCCPLSLPPASLSVPNNSRVSLLKRPPLGLSLNRTFSRLRLQSRFRDIKWRFLGYKHENFSSEEIPGSELIEDKLSEDLVMPKCDQSKNLKRDWLSSSYKGLDAVLGVEPWTVPWTAKTIVQVMLLWITSFWLVGSWIVPFLAYTAGFRKESLTVRGQALYSLLTDVAERCGRDCNASSLSR